MSARVSDTPAPALIRGIIVAAWVTAAAGHVTGWDQNLGHGELLGDGFSVWPGLALFLLGWQVMVAAMMLPSSLPAFRRFDGIIPEGAHRTRLLGGFLGGYAFVWSGFGIGAFLGDGVVHGIAHQWPWLDARPWIIGGAALLIAGGFELVARADPGRHPASVPGGVRAAGRLVPAEVPALAIRSGAAHGLQRLRRCWPVMVLSVAVGMTSLAWMAALTGVMAMEGRGRPGRVTGAGLVTVGALVLINPTWLPPLLPPGS